MECIFILGNIIHLPIKNKNLKELIINEKKIDVLDSITMSKNIFHQLIKNFMILS